MAQDEPNIARHRPNLGQYSPKMGPMWLNMGPTWPNISPRYGPKMAQHGPDLAQHGHNLRSTYAQTAYRHALLEAVQRAAPTEQICPCALQTKLDQGDETSNHGA